VVTLRAVPDVDGDGARVAGPLAVRIEAPRVQAGLGEQAECGYDRGAKSGHERADRTAGVLDDGAALDPAALVCLQNPRSI
jgi:hypothetical protein